MSTVTLADEIQNVGWDVVFTLSGTGEVARVTDVYAPTVEHDPTDDVMADDSGWEFVTGYTQQYGYNGAVMHTSEGIGSRIADHLQYLADTAREDGNRVLFVQVVVESDNPEDGSVGWTIAYRTEPLIHVVSATSVYADDTRDPNRTNHLGMCGTNLGPYAEASKVHPVGNYISATSPAFARVTCEGCRARYH